MVSSQVNPTQNTKQLAGTWRSSRPWYCRCQDILATDILSTDGCDTSSIFLSRNYNQGFLFGLPTSHAFLQSAQVGFIDLHYPGQPITPRSDHRPTELVKPSPSLFVTPQAQHPLHAQGAGAVLLGDHPPHGLKPQPQWATCVLENRPSCDRGLMTASSTLQQHPAQRPILFTTTARTPKPIGPPEAEQILPTSFLCGKTGFKLRQLPRVIFHSGAILHLVVSESREYPEWSIQIALPLRGFSRAAHGRLQAYDRSRPHA